MKAVVLAGGKGTKMFPFTTYHQKCCLPIGNTPNIVRIVQQLINEEVENITVIIDEHANEIKAELTHFPVTFIHGTNTTLLSILQHELNEDALVYYGDIVIPQKVLHEIIVNFRENGNTALVQALTNDLRSQDYICAQVENNEVLSVYGHPRTSYVNSRFGGVFYFEQAVWALLQGINVGFESINCGQMPDDEFHLENVITKALQRGIPIRAINSCEMVDLDFPWDLFQANQWHCASTIGALREIILDPTTRISQTAIIRGYLKTGKNCFIGDHVIIKGNLELGDNVRIEDGAVIYPNCIIGDNTIINDYCKISSHSVIGKNNKIGYHAEFGGVTFNGVAQVHSSEVYGIVGTSVDIAAGCIMGMLKFDDTYVSQKVLGKRYSNPHTNIICIGDYTRTGVGNLFYPGVKIGSNCALGPGLVINEDIAPGQLIMPKQEKESHPWGPRRYGW